MKYNLKKDLRTFIKKDRYTMYVFIGLIILFILAMTFPRIAFNQDDDINTRLEQIDNEMSNLNSDNNNYRNAITSIEDEINRLNELKSQLQTKIQGNSERWQLLDCLGIAIETSFESFMLKPVIALGEDEIAKLKSLCGFTQDLSNQEVAKLLESRNKTIPMRMM